MNALIAISEDCKLIYCCRLQELLPYKLVRFSYIGGRKIMGTAYSRFWHNILNFSGTAKRSEYWWPVIINYVLGDILGWLLEKAIGHPVNDIYTWGDLNVNVITLVITFVVWLATLSLKFRRLHDTDRSGWWILINILPFIGQLWFFILMVLPTKRNRYAGH